MLLALAIYLFDLSHDKAEPVLSLGRYILLNPMSSRIFLAYVCSFPSKTFPA